MANLDSIFGCRVKFTLVLLLSVLVVLSSANLLPEPVETNAKVIEDDEGSWRELQEGEGMPVGAHVRIDMSGSGKKYIKLDPNQIKEAIDSEMKDTEDCKEMDECEPHHPDIVNMENVLNALPEPDPRMDAVKKLRLENPEKYEQALREIWEKRQAELKEAMEAMVDETKMIQDSLQILATDNATQDNILESLDSLEDLVQSIDHAKDFYSMGGLEITAIHLQSSSSEVRTAASFVIGSASKALKKLQDHARTEHILEKLVSLISIDTTESNDQMQKENAKLLYAVGALIRGNTKSQDHVAQHNLANRLVRLLQHPGDQILSDFQVRLKAVTLLEDIIHDGTNECNDDSSDDPEIVVIPVNSNSTSSENNGESSKKCSSTLYEEVKKEENLCPLIKRNMLAIQQLVKSGSPNMSSLQKLWLELKQLAELSNCDY